MVCHVDHQWGRPAWKNPIGCHDVSSGVIFHRMIPGGCQTLTVQSLQLLLPDFPLQRANSDKKCVAGWWFQNILYIFHILGIMIPTDEHIFQRGRSTTNQVGWQVCGSCGKSMGQILELEQRCLWTCQEWRPKAWVSWFPTTIFFADSWWIGRNCGLGLMMMNDD